MATDPFESYLGPDGFPATTCDPLSFPAPNFSDCPEAYVAHEGEIAELFLSNVQYNEDTGKYEAVTLPADWTTRASYNVSGIIRLVGFGDKPLAAPVSIPLPKGLTKIIDRKHTLNFDFTDQPIENYELVRAIQGTGLCALNYVDLDSAVYGGENMIIVRVANAGNVHTRGENALLTGQLIFEWDNLFDPPREELDAEAPLKMGKVKAPAALKNKAPQKQLEGVEV